jgi:hypothetical protein
VKFSRSSAELKDTPQVLTATEPEAHGKLKPGVVRWRNQNDSKNCTAISRRYTNRFHGIERLSVVARCKLCVIWARTSLDILRVTEKCRGLVAGSAAAAAGLRNDDVIVESSRLADVQDDSTQLMRLKVRQRSAELTVSYLPRGAVVPGYHWVRVPNVPDIACKL